MKVSTIREQGNKILASLDEPADPIEGALWLDLNDSNTHPLVNSGSLVEKKIITIDCSSVTFTGLNSLVDGDYYLEFDIVNNLGAGNDIRVSVNGNTTSTNYWRWYRWNNGNSYSNNVQARANDNISGIWANTGNGCTGTARFSVVKGKFVSDVRCMLYDSTNHACMQDGVVWSTFDITSINTLLLSAGTSIIGAGSVFRLFKSNAAQQLVPYNPIDISSRTSDYYLKPGEIVYIDFTNATTAPLNIATVEGEYELTIIGNGTNTTYTASPTYLRPNNTTYGNAFSYLEYGKEISTSDAGGSKTLDSYGTGSHSAIQIAYQQLLKANFFITTHTVAKCVIGSHIRKSSATKHVFNRNQVIWEDTTTAWTSLGTIVFPFTHSGKIIIKRII